LATSLGEIISLTEPYLQFTTGKEGSTINPRVGLSKFHPLDYNSGRRIFSSVNLGVIAKESEIKFVLGLLNDLNNNFNPERGSSVPYVGFEQIYKASIDLPEIDSNGIALINNVEIREALESENPFYAILRLYSSKIQRLINNNLGPIVLVLQIPNDFENYFVCDYNGQREDLRAHIKARCAEKHIKTQILTQNALSPYDKCDDLWNLSLGIYVKAGGVPWKLRDTEENMCFIGIAFGIKKSERGQEILVGLAEVFDEYGDHVTINVVEDVKTDRGYYLSKNKMAELVKLAIRGYEDEKDGKTPRYVVIHKTSPFNDEEKSGVEKVMKDIKYDLVFTQMGTTARLFPRGAYPPNRGTFWKVDQNRGILYTTGKVEEFGTYPGPGTPTPIEINKNYGELTIEALAKQILGLTKMNWNTTALMNKEPITIGYAKKVVEVIKAGLRVERILKDFRFYI